MIHFVKILKYDMKPDDKQAFEYLCGVVSQRIDPPSLEPGSLRLSAPVVFHSPLRRSLECLKMEEGVRYIPSPALREIPFDMKLMCSEKEWLSGKSSLVRKRFKELFMEDRLMMKRDRILGEIRQVLGQCRSLSGVSDVDLVSHSFRMKVIQVFIETKGEIERRPSLINEYIRDGERTFDFGKGFIITKEDLSFLDR